MQDDAYREPDGEQSEDGVGHCSCEVAGSRMWSTMNVEIRKGCVVAGLCVNVVEDSERYCGDMTCFRDSLK